MRLNLTSYDYMRHGALVREYSERKGNLAHHDTECEPRLTFTRLLRLVGRRAIPGIRGRGAHHRSGTRLRGRALGASIAPMVTMSGMQLSGPQ